MNNNSANYYDYIYKILLLGDCSVGKTCFLLRYSDDTFTENHISTIGLDYRLKMVNMDNSKIVKMQIWDTAGQDRFRAITKNYFKGAHGIILIYDITSMQSFNNIKNWLGQIKDNTNEKVRIVLVGNKCDYEINRKVSKAEAQKLADEYGMILFEASAKDNTNVEETFRYLNTEIFNVNHKEQETPTSGRDVKGRSDSQKLRGDKKGDKGKKKCC